MRVTVTNNLYAVMRDGTKLYCDLYRPDDEKKYPVVLMRTPYLKDTQESCRDYSNPYRMASHGYNVVIQDVRGTGESEGSLKTTGENEVNDGYDTVEWCAVQEWSNGRVGMFGLSYFGFTQLAAAEERPPHLVAICPFEMSGRLPFSVSKSYTVSSYHLRWIYDQVLTKLKRTNENGKNNALIARLQDNLEQMGEYEKHLPLREMPAAYVDGAPILLDYIEVLDHADDPLWWERIHKPLRFSNMDVPMFHLAGWADAAHEGVVDNYETALREGTTEHMSRHQKIMLGPWIHGGDFVHTIDGIEYGRNAGGDAADIEGQVVRWFDYWLKGIDNGIMSESLVSLFVMGKNIWREENEWPISRTQYTGYYLHSGGNAATSDTDGVLTTIPPENEPEDRYIYDPYNPVPSSLPNELGACFIQNQRPSELRSDVLVYTTPVLTEDIEVTGHIQLILYISTDAVDTDFVCILTDVYPEGRSIPLSSGIIRARYRNGIKPAFLTPGKIYELVIDAGTTSNVFLEGHRIRIDITSSNFPANDRNLNTGEKTGAGSTFVTAAQIVYHNSEYPSKLILPVIPS